MTILILYTHNQGFLSHFFEEVSTRLSDKGHRVIIYSLKSKSYNKNIGDVSLIVKTKGSYYKNYRSIFKIIKTIKPDVVVSNFSYVNPALLFGRLLGVSKNVVWFHSLNEQTSASAKNVFIKRAFLKLADFVIANSHITKEELNTDFKVAISKIVSIPFWTPVADDHLEKDMRKEPLKHLKIGCPGRLVAHKNQKVVLEALAKMNTKNFELHIAGTGDSQPELRKTAINLGINHQVLFVGHLSGPEMVKFYKAMDVVILPSLSEAFGLVFIEAIALGTPVIVSSRFGALTFISDREQLEKFTFEPESANELKEKLNPYFKSKGLESDYFRALYRNNYNKDAIFEQIYQILRTDC
ncbi:MAG: glycosyltransferase family 4 protein [Aquaticitalea sp.]